MVAPASGPDGTFVWEHLPADGDVWTEVARTPMPRLVTSGLAVELIADGADEQVFTMRGNGPESRI